MLNVFENVFWACLYITSCVCLEIKHVFYNVYTHSKLSLSFPIYSFIRFNAKAVFLYACVCLWCKKSALFVCLPRQVF